MGFFEMIRIRTSNIENFIRSTYSGRYLFFGGSIINLRINSIDVRNDLLKVKLYFCSQKEQEMWDMQDLIMPRMRYSFKLDQQTNYHKLHLDIYEEEYFLPTLFLVRYGSHVYAFENQSKIIIIMLPCG